MCYAVIGLSPVISCGSVAEITLMVTSHSVDHCLSLRHASNEDTTRSSAIANNHAMLVQTSRGFSTNNTASTWSTCHCPAWLQPIWPPTVSWSPTTVVVTCVLPHQGRALWDESTCSNYGDRCFAAADNLYCVGGDVKPCSVNRSCGTAGISLPADLRQAEFSFQRFKRLLKTFLFCCWYRGALWLPVKAAPHYKFSYLLTYLLISNPYCTCLSVQVSA